MVKETMHVIISYSDPKICKMFRKKRAIASCAWITNSFSWLLTCEFTDLWAEINNSYAHRLVLHVEALLFVHRLVTHAHKFETFLLFHDRKLIKIFWSIFL